MSSALSTEPFDLVSEPDAASRDLRDQLAAFGYVAGLADPEQRVILPGEEWSRVCRDALDLVTGLLMLRRALVVLMQSTKMEALALPFSELALASLVPLRVTHQPDVLPNLLQLRLPGEGLVTVSSSAYNEPPPAFDSEGASETERLRAACVQALELLERRDRDDDQSDTVEQLLRVTLRR